MKITNSGYRLASSKKELSSVVALSNVIGVCLPPFDTLDAEIAVVAAQGVLEKGDFNLNEFLLDNETKKVLRVSENERELVDLLDVRYCLCVVYPSSEEKGLLFEESTAYASAWLPSTVYWLSDHAFIANEEVDAELPNAGSPNNGEDEEPTLEEGEQDVY